MIRDWRSGDIGRLVALHGAYYAGRWAFAPCFEAEVAEEMGAFCRRIDPSREGLWVMAEDGAPALGGIALQAEIDGAARVRWFMVDPAAHGQGVGEALLKHAVNFARAGGYGRIRLHTFRGLDAAHRLYRRHGFVLTDEMAGAPWGPPLMLQTFELEVCHDRA